MSFSIGQNLPGTKDFRDFCVVTDNTAKDNQVILELYDPGLNGITQPRKTLRFGGSNGLDPKILLDALDYIDITKDTTVANIFAYSELYGLIGRDVHHISPHDLRSAYIIALIFRGSLEKIIIATPFRSEIANLYNTLRKIRTVI